MGTCSKSFKSFSISFTIIIIILEWLVANLISLNLHVNIYSSVFECVRCSIMDIKYNKFYSILFIINK